MKYKKFLIILIAIISLFISFVFFRKSNYKKINTGNNITSKSLDENEKYILDINSYIATIELTVQSNKNTNKYLIKQEVNNDIYKQEVIEPDNIKGVQTIYEKGKLTVYNSKLNLNKIYEDYPYITENSIFLNDFIAKYKIAKQNNKFNIQETEDYIILTINNKNSIEKLYVQKNSGKPYQIIIQDDDKKNIVYILYKEINL